MIKKSDVIVQFSPPRTGSTLVYNILKEISSKKIIKAHQFDNHFNRLPIVTTYRHPLDCIASSILRYQMIPTDDIIAEQVKELKVNGFDSLTNLKNSKNMLLLKYELFVNDFDYIFDNMEKFFEIIINEDQRVEYKNKYSIKEVKRITSKYQTFSEYDNVSHWHGQHISKFEGACFYYEKFFNIHQIKNLKIIFKDFLEKFGYV